MVVFDGAARSPAYFYNEKIMCGLGKGLAETGRLNPEGRKRALAALKRFSLLAEGMGIAPLTVVATAATREAEEQLRRLNESLEQRVQERTQERDRIWQLSTDLMLVADFNGRIVAVNPAWTRLLGWQRHELEGSSFYDFIHPQDSVAAVNACTELALGQSFSRVENRFRHKDGSYRWVSWSAVPDPQHLHAVGRDIQAEREAAQALRKTEDILRQAQKMEAVGQLTGGVAHDFNNLLTVIRSSTDLLRRNLSEERRQLYIDAISDTVDRASKLTAQLLAYARQQNLRPETFDVGVSVQLLAQMINPLIGACIELRIELPQQACCIHADAGQFDTALINMAVNARDAMQGEGLLVIAVERVAQIVEENSAAQGGIVQAIQALQAMSGRLQGVMQRFSF